MRQFPECSILIIYTVKRSYRHDRALIVDVPMSTRVAAFRCNSAESVLVRIRDTQTQNSRSACLRRKRRWPRSLKNPEFSGARSLTRSVTAKAKYHQSLHQYSIVDWHSIKRAVGSQRDSSGSVRARTVAQITADRDAITNLPLNAPTDLNTNSVGGIRHLELRVVRVDINTSMSEAESNRAVRSPWTFCEVIEQVAGYAPERAIDFNQPVGLTRWQLSPGLPWQDWQGSSQARVSASAVDGSKLWPRHKRSSTKGQTCVKATAS